VRDPGIGAVLIRSGLDVLRFDDLLFAKVLGEQGILAFEQLKELVKAADAGAGRVPALALARGYLRRDDPRLEAVKGKMKQYSFVMADGIFTELVKRSGLIDAPVLTRMREFQQRGGQGFSLQQIIVRAGYLDGKALSGLITQCRQRIAAHKEWIVKSYRNMDFEALRGTSQGSSAKPRPAAAPRPVGEAQASIPNFGDSRGDPFRGRMIGGRYQLERRLGQGNMGVVYLGKEREAGRLVAVKLVLPQRAKADVLERFRREVVATSKFSHPHVVELYDAGELPDGTNYMVLEYVEGEELRALLKREKRLATARGLRLVEQMLEGLGGAHAAQVIHKDLKPENLMITTRDGVEHLKIMDFGLARVLDSEDSEDRMFVTMEGQFSGSPAYIAPESITNEAIDARTDLYSVGIILFELLTGSLPIAGKNMRAMLTGHLYRSPRKLSELRPELDCPELEDLIGRLLEKKARNRFSDCGEALGFIRDRVRPALQG
jgi:hypothetical protein